MHKTLEAVIMQAPRNFDSWGYWFSLKTHECLLTRLEFVFLSNLSDICSCLSPGCFPHCCSISELPIHFQTSEGQMVWQEKKNSVKLEAPGTLHVIQDRRVKLWIKAQTWEIYPQEIIIHSCSSSSSSSTKGSSLGIWVSCRRNSMHNDF